jgi:hypothetical protein
MSSFEESLELSESYPTNLIDPATAAHETKRYQVSLQNRSHTLFTQYEEDVLVHACRHDEVNQSK